MEQIHDSKGNRLIKCEKCKEIKNTDYFVIYGGKGKENSGICRECAKKKGMIK